MDINPKSPQIDIKTLEKLIDLFGLCLYKVNLQTKDICLNENTTRITGHSLTDLPNTEHTKQSLMFPEDIKLLTESVRSIISGEKDHYRIEYRMRRKDGGTVSLDELAFISEYDEEGKPLYMSAIASNLTRAKYAEEKAQALEAEMHRMALEKDVHILAEENRLLRAANAASEIIIGGFHEDYELLLQRSLGRLAESIVADSAFMWRNSDHINGLGCFLRSCWNNGANVVGSGANKNIFLYDEIAPDWLSYLPDYKCFDSQSLPYDFVQLCQAEEAKHIIFIPIYIHGEFWGLVGFSRRNDVPFMYYEADAMLKGAIIIACSVSRNETLGKINFDKEKAVANTLAKGEFLSRMSHELRTPLNAIIGMTNIAIKEKDYTRMHEHLKKVGVSSQLLLNIINDVLDISKIDAGKLEIVKEPFNFVDMLTNAENIIRVKIDEKHQNFKINCDKSINRKIISDEQRLLQVIVNLLNNAMKFTPEYGYITVNAFQRKISDNRVKLRVEVRDSGIGLTSEQQNKIFIAFEQADGSTTRKFGGTGLGLAICKKILKALGGDIWVKSKFEQGSCFFFEFEADLGEEINDGENSAYNDKAADSPENTVHDWSRHTVLLAEDVEINREIVEIMLEDTGIHIVCAMDGNEAVEKFNAEPQRYSLILMDIQMPVMDGLTATKIIRETNAEVPIIAMTANAFKEDIDICIQAKMNGHIAKPIVEGMFFKVLEKFLGK